MLTISKREMIERIAARSSRQKVIVRKLIQEFLDEIISELGKGNRLEFRGFGVFDVKVRKARRAQNPRTMAPVRVPEKRFVKFKQGRLMRECLKGAAGQEKMHDPDDAKADKPARRKKAPMHE